MSGWRPPGLVPPVAPGDLKAAFTMLLPIIRSIRAEKAEGATGISESLFRDVCKPGANPTWVALRAGIIIMALEAGALEALRNGDNLPDNVFEIAATYPFILAAEGDFEGDFDLGAFVQALGGSV